MYKTMIASALFFGLLTIAYLQQKRNVPKKIVFLFAVLELIMCLCTSLLTNFVLTKDNISGLTVAVPRWVCFWEHIYLQG